jgi:hypothetical protein
MMKILSELEEAEHLLGELQSQTMPGREFLPKPSKNLPKSLFSPIFPISAPIAPRIWHRRICAKRDKFLSLSFWHSQASKKGRRWQARAVRPCRSGGFQRQLGGAQ